MSHAFEYSQQARLITLEIIATTRMNQSNLVKFAAALPQCTVIINLFSLFVSHVHPRVDTWKNFSGILLVDGDFLQSETVYVCL